LSIATLVLTAASHGLARGALLRKSKLLRVEILERSFEMPIVWHQSHSSPDLVTALLTKNVPKILDGLFVQLPIFCRSVTTAVLGMAVSFWADAYLSALILACVLPSLFCINVLIKLATRRIGKELDDAEEAGTAVVRNALGQIAAVQNLNIHGLFGSRYSSIVSTTRRANARIGFASAFGDTALTNLVFCLSYALVVWRGGQRVPGDVITVLFASLNAGYNAGLCIPALNRVLEGVDAYRNVRETFAGDAGVDNPSDNADDYGITAGRLELKNLSFRYPGTKQNTIEGIDLTVEPGTRMAIVGASGCGKVSCLSQFVFCLSYGRCFEFSLTPGALS
jgi:ABC-type multidrug transport system fused ATPase/permease subunit